MRNVTTIIRYEYKIQFTRPAAWGVLFAATIFSLLDDFPSAGNLARLEFLKHPAYFVCRTMNFGGLVLMFGLIFLLAECIPSDAKTGMKPLLMSYPLQKWQYLSGKLLGGFLYTFSMLCIFLTLNTAVYFVAAPFEISLTACILPLAKTIAFSAFPVSLFVGFCSVALPGMMDIRLFYLLAAVFFGLNATHVGSADSAPFYLLTSGDLLRLIWVHPKWPFADVGSIWANGAFLIAGALISGGFLFLTEPKARGTRVKRL